jgi:hypothetical protein
VVELVGRLDAAGDRAVDQVVPVVAGEPGEAVAEDFGAVGADPDEFGRRFVATDAAVDEGAVDAEALEDLRHLTGLAPVVGRVAGLHAGRAERFGDELGAQEVADEGFRSDVHRVGQGVPRADQQAALAEEPLHLLAPLGAHFEVVLEQDDVGVEREGGVARVGLEQVERVVEHLEQAAAGDLEGLAEFTVPVRVADDVDFTNGGGGHGGMLLGCVY